MNSPFPTHPSALYRLFPAFASGRSLSLLLVFGLCFCGKAFGASYSWDPNSTSGAAVGGSGTWDASVTPPLKWFNGAIDAPWPNDTTVDPTLTAVFAGAVGTVSVSGSLNVNSVVFQTSGYVIQSGTLAFGGTTPTISFGSPGMSGTINTVITGTSGLTISGSGSVLALGGSANTYTGTTTLSAGTYLRLNSPTATGSNQNPGQPLSMNNGSSLELNILNGVQVFNNINVTGTATLLTGTAATGTINIGNNTATNNGAISSSGTARLIFSNSGSSPTLSLSGSMNGFTGSLVWDSSAPSAVVVRANGTTNQNLG
ncbi:MAG: hypothetical protein QOD99_1028, partial [Chthoniobacter sp.]|nr:hypothetical protein [Chthoniobacter sp.]